MDFFNFNGETFKLNGDIYKSIKNNKKLQIFKIFDLRWRNSLALLNRIIENFGEDEYYYIIIKFFLIKQENYWNVIVTPFLKTAENETLEVQIRILIHVLPGISWIQNYGSHCNISPKTIINTGEKWVISNFEKFINYKNLYTELKIAHKNFNIYWTEPDAGREEAILKMDIINTYDGNFIEWNNLVDNFLNVKIFKSNTGIVLLYDYNDYNIYCHDNGEETEYIRNNEEEIIYTYNSEINEKNIINIKDKNIFKEINSYSINNIDLHFHKNFRRINNEKIPEKEIKNITRIFDKVNKQRLYFKYPEYSIFTDGKDYLVKLHFIYDYPNLREKNIRFLENLCRS